MEMSGDRSALAASYAEVTEAAVVAALGEAAARAAGGE